jgi:hypothetical protein
MSEALVPQQSAVAEMRKADQQWEAAIRGFENYPTRLRALAEAADLRSRTLMLAHLANIAGKPRPGAGQLGKVRALAPELSPKSDRSGPAALWRRFDQAVADIGAGLEAGDFPRTAAAFSALSSVAAELADVGASAQAKSDNPAKRHSA